MKTCASCGETKPVTDFHRKKASRDGLHTYCKPCTKARNSAWVKANRDKHRETCAKWYAQNKTKANAVQSCWHYRKSYGITKQQFLDLVAAASGKCRICNTPVVVGSRALNGAVLDHSHATGQIRGVLCHACNKGLGLFADDPIRLQQAVAYLSEAA